MAESITVTLLATLSFFTLLIAALRTRDLIHGTYSRWSWSMIGESMTNVSSRPSEPERIQRCSLEFKANGRIMERRWNEGLLLHVAGNSE